MKKVIFLTTALIITAFFLASCEPVPPDSQNKSGKPDSKPQASSSLTLDQVKNAEYKTDTVEGGFQLTNGEYHYTPLGAPSVGAEYFTSIENDDLVAFGDLDSDGSGDAAVILGSWTGGTGYFLELAVLVNKEGQAYNIATTGLGDRVEIDSISIENGVITVDMITHGPDDALCCPTQEKKAQYKLSGSQLIELQ